MRLFQNFSFWNSYLKKPQFCRLQAEKLQEPVPKQPVLEQAHIIGSALAILLGVVVSAPLCAQAGAPAQPPLAGTSWTLRAMRGESGTALDAVRVEQPPALAFGENGLVSGFAGVNRLSGPFTAEDGALSFSTLALTRRMSFSNELNQLEMDFAKRLNAVRYYTVEKDTLQLLDEAKKPLLTFTRGA
jgi:heat shock protein HslJ